MIHFTMYFVRHFKIDGSDCGNPGAVEGTSYFQYENLNIHHPMSSKFYDQAPTVTTVSIAVPNGSASWRTQNGMWYRQIYPRVSNIFLNRLSPNSNRMLLQLRYLSNDKWRAKLVEAEYFAHTHIRGEAIQDSGFRFDFYY